MNCGLMPIEVITKADLEEFRVKLLNDLKKLINTTEKPVSKKWLRSYEVKQLLGISTGTLQNFTINGVLHPRKIGGLNYFNMEEIDSLLNGKNSSGRFDG
jgi:hypothetical protein